MINLKIALRHLLKEKFFVTVNLIGLTVALAVALVIISFVGYHHSYDRHVAGYDRVYRIISRINNGTFWASTFSAFDKALEDQSEIESYTTFYKNDEQFDLLNGDGQVRIKDPVYGDRRFIEFFGIELKSGDVSSLEEPKSNASENQMLADLVKGHEFIAKQSRELIAKADDVNDEATADLLTARTEVHEKSAWMLRSMLEE